ncbi:MAG TPA: hypothetical protein VF384_03275 [Planctomycetota bacterium]
MDPLQRARRFGWWSLLVWLSLGLVLETMHGFKVGWYLDVVNDARRLMLRLAHAHGTLIALVNLAFAATIRASDASPALARGATCLRWAGVLMPVGFLGGGIQIFGADPGFAIVLVPVGAVCLFVGVLAAARATRDGGAHSAAPKPQVQSKPPAAKR